MSSIPYTAPPNFVTGAVLTEAQLDILSDDISFLANPPHCRVYNSAAFSHTSTGNNVAVTFDSERRDTDTMHSTATNTSRITFTTAGFYAVGGHVEFAANATGVRGIAIRLGGATYIAADNRLSTGGALGTQMSIATRYAFAAGDYVELMAYQSSGGNLNINAAGNFSPEFWAEWEAL